MAALFASEAAILAAEGAGIYQALDKAYTYGEGVYKTAKGEYKSIHDYFYPRRAPRRAHKTVSRIKRPARKKKDKRAYQGSLKELKFLDCLIEGRAVTAPTTSAGAELQPTAGCLNALSVPAQGVAENDRNGRHYTIKSIFLSGSVTTSNVSSTTNQCHDYPGYFFALVLDKQTNGDAINSEDVYTTGGSLLPSTRMPQPLRNLQHIRRFQILDSVYLTCGGMYAARNNIGVMSTGAQETPTFTLSWKGDLDVYCTNTANDVADVSNYSIHLIGFAGGTGLVPVLNAKSRLRFTG